MAEYLEAEHVLAVASGTAALHLALVALGVGPGDEVITTPITWPATANVIVHAGATPVFVDVRDDDLNIDPGAVAAARDRADEGDPARRTSPASPATSSRSGSSGCRSSRTPRTRSRARYRGRKLGGLSDATCFSLYATKNVAAGEGGLIATNRDDVADGVRDLRLMRRGDGSLYDIAVPGYKANLSDVLAAIALVQLDKLRAARADPRSGSSRSTTRPSPSSTAIEPLARDARDTHALHLYVVRIDAERAGADARRVPAGARGGAHRDEHPLPAGAPADLVPRALPRASRRCRWPSARAPRCCRCRSRRRTPTTTSRDAVAALRARARALHAHEPRDPRPSLTLALTGLAVAYLVWKIDLGQTLEILARREPRAGSRSPSRS